MTDTNFSIIRASSSGCERQVIEHPRQDLPSGDQEEEHRVQHHEQVEHEGRGAAREGGEAVDQEASRGPRQLAEPRDDDVLVGVQPAQLGHLPEQLVEQVGRRELSLDPRADRFGDAEPLRDHDARERGQRDDQEQDDDHDRQDGRGPGPAAEARRETAMHRVRSSR